MDKSDNYDPSSWFNEWKKLNKSAPKHRLSEYLKDTDMEFSNNFDDFLKKAKDSMSGEEWDKFMKNAQKKYSKSGPGSSGMIIMFEEDYENLIEMRGLFKNTNRPEYVDTLNKILGTIRPSEGM
jgi:hypothetical protein